MQIVGAYFTAPLGVGPHRRWVSGSLRAGDLSSDASDGMAVRAHLGYGSASCSTSRILGYGVCRLGAPTGQRTFLNVRGHG